MKKLVDILNYHTRLYDEGHPEWSDKEWDEKYFELVFTEKYVWKIIRFTKIIGTTSKS